MLGGLPGAGKGGVGVKCEKKGGYNLSNHELFEHMQQVPRKGSKTWIIQRLRKRDLGRAGSVELCRHNFEHKCCTTTVLQF